MGGDNGQGAISFKELLPRLRHGRSLRVRSRQAADYRHPAASRAV